MSSDLNYEYAKAYHKYLLKQAEQSRLAHLAQATRKDQRQAFSIRLPKPWRLLSGWPTRVIQLFSKKVRTSEASESCNLSCEACS